MTASMSLTEAAHLFLEHLEAQGKHPRTLSTYHRDLKQIQAFFGPDRPVHTLTLPWMGRFLKSDELLTLPNGTPRAEQTIKKTIRVFRMLFSWLHQTGALTELTLPKGFQKKWQRSAQTT